MLWFLLTAYLCVGCFVAGATRGGGKDYGVKHPVKLAICHILFWPIGNVDLRSIFTKQ